MIGHRILSAFACGTVMVLGQVAPAAAQITEQSRAAAEREAECGSLFNSVGPFDYRTRDSTPQRHSTSTHTAACIQACGPGR